MLFVVKLREVLRHQHTIRPHKSLHIQYHKLFVPNSKTGSICITLKLADERDLTSSDTIMLHCCLVCIDANTNIVSAWHRSSLSDSQSYSLTHFRNSFNNCFCFLPLSVSPRLSRQSHCIGNKANIKNSDCTFLRLE